MESKIPHIRRVFLWSFSMIVSVSKIQSGSLDYFFTSHAHKQKIKGKYHIFEGGWGCSRQNNTKNFEIWSCSGGGGGCSCWIIRYYFESIIPLSLSPFFMMFSIRKNKTYHQNWLGIFVGCWEWFGANTSSLLFLGGGIIIHLIRKKNKSNLGCEIRNPFYYHKILPGIPNH